MEPVAPAAPVPSPDIGAVAETSVDDPVMAGSVAVVVVVAVGSGAVIVGAGAMSGTTMVGCTGGGVEVVGNAGTGSGATVVGAGASWASSGVELSARAAAIAALAQRRVWFLFIIARPKSR